MKKELWIGMDEDRSIFTYLEKPEWEEYPTGSCFGGKYELLIQIDTLGIDTSRLTPGDAFPVTLDITIGEVEHIAPEIEGRS